MTPHPPAQLDIIPCLVLGNLWPITLRVQCAEPYGVFWSHLRSEVRLRDSVLEA